MKKFSLAVVCGLVLAGCSSHQWDSKHALEHWGNYHSEPLPASLNDNQALAVVYRSAEFDSVPVNVYVNGDYQASLLEKGFSQVVVCSHNQHFSASYTTNKQFGNRTQGVSYELSTQEPNFIKVVKDAEGHPTFTRVSADVAKAELGNLRGMARHTLPRVVTKRECETVVGNTTLSAGALWGLNKHSYQDMLPQGKKEIAEFVEFVKGNREISRIEVRGYTDPEASEAYNLALSQQRANSVRQALMNAGIVQRIDVKGYGEADLVVANCEALHPNNPKAKTACNQPNRRVEITTYTK